MRQRLYHLLNFPILLITAAKVAVVSSNTIECGKLRTEQTSTLVECIYNSPNDPNNRQKCICDFRRNLRVMTQRNPTLFTSKGKGTVESGCSQKFNIPTILRLISNVCNMDDDMNQEDCMKMVQFYVELKVAERTEQKMVEEQTEQKMVEEQTEQKMVEEQIKQKMVEVEPLPPKPIQPFIVPTPEPPATDPTPSREEAFKSIISSFSFDNGAAALEDSSSPQSAALNWLIFHDPAEISPFDESPKNQLVIKQRYAAATLFSSTPEEEPWEEEREWMRGKDVCSWYGIKCKGSSDGNTIVEINLRSNNVGGNIPPEIGLIDSLKVLSLSDNVIYGKIPDTLWSIDTLEALFLDRNYLSGEIPASIGNMVNLESFWIDDNGLNGEFPSTLWQLTSLVELHMQGNQFYGSLSSDISNLSNLESLDISGSSLSGPIPSEVGQLGEISVLSLSANDFNGTIPSEIGFCQNVKELHLDNNDLIGTIPTDFGNLLDLESLRLDWNLLNSTIPTELGKLANLGILKLNNNHFTGPLPDNIGDMKELVDFQANSNKYEDGEGLSGKLPLSLGSLNKLTNLALHENSFSGEIPGELGQLNSLEIATLDSNDLNGTMPESICDLELETLVVDCNGIEPKVFCDCCSSCEGSIA